jgi:hypothetical protein
VTRFTPLESDILDALAWDLRDIAPDLAGQFAESLPGSRRNTGSGLFTELIVDRFRPPPMTTPTGRFGTVHAMVGDLPDPIAFQVELRAGRLLSLHGDAYGQDTRAIDFARVPFDQVFTLDDRGESVAFDPTALMQPSPLLDPHQHTDHEPPHPVADPPLINLGALQRVRADRCLGRHRPRRRVPHRDLPPLLGLRDHHGGHAWPTAPQAEGPVGPRWRQPPSRPVRIPSAPTVNPLKLPAIDTHRPA